MTKKLKIDLSIGDSAKVLRENFEENSVDVLVTDPPYGLGQEPDPIELLRGWVQEGTHAGGTGGGFMNANWDSMVPGPGIWKEIYRVMKPGARGGAFCGTRTLHLMIASLRIAGFSIENVYAWCYGCFDEKTEVLVDGSWVRYDTLEAGQMIRSFDPKTQQMVDLPIQEVIKIPDYEDIAYHVTSANSDQLVSHNHRMITKSMINNSEEAKTIDALYGSDFEIPVVGSGYVSYQKANVKRLKSYQGMMWCVRVPTGMVVVRRNGKISVSGNSGFPKSQNVFKVLQKKLKKDGRYGEDGELRCECCSEDPSYRYDDTLYDPDGLPDKNRESERKLILDDYDSNDLVSRVCSWCLLPDDQYVESINGMGTAIKPSWEPITIVRKPLSEINLDLEALLKNYGCSDEQVQYIMTPPK